jgi:hypothetical protein
VRGVYTVLNDLGSLSIKLAIIFPLQHFAKYRKLSQRLAQIMTGGMGELPQIAVGSREFLSLARQSLLGSFALGDVG